MGQKYWCEIQPVMTIIKVFNDINHLNSDCSNACLLMIFSKTFGYALRGVLYVSMISQTKPRVQLDEMAEQLAVPRHFLGKVMKKLVKDGVLNSMKGPFGGFCMNEKTLEVTLFELMEITGEVEEFSSCVLRLRNCNPKNPCPIHNQIDVLRKKWQHFLSTTTIGDLIKKNQPDFISSIAAI